MAVICTMGCGGWKDVRNPPCTLYRHDLWKPCSWGDVMENYGTVNASRHWKSAGEHNWQGVELEIAITSILAPDVWPGADWSIGLGCLWLMAWIWYVQISTITWNTTPGVFTTNQANVMRSWRSLLANHFIWNHAFTLKAWLVLHKVLSSETNSSGNMNKIFQIAEWKGPDTV